MNVRTDGSVAVLIPTFGDAARWNGLAARALASVANQTRPPDEVIRHHFHSVEDPKALGTMRNFLAAHATAEWICFLDADDEIEPGYLEAMLSSSGDVRIPMLRLCCGTPDEKIKLPEPFEVPPKANLLEGNHIVIGALIRRDAFLKLGGFDDFEVAEDWTLWLKAWLAGAKMNLVQGAIYRQNWRPGGRNQTDQDYYRMICGAIRKRYYPAAERRGLVKGE